MVQVGIGLCLAAAVRNEKQCSGHAERLRYVNGGTSLFTTKWLHNTAQGCRKAATLGREERANTYARGRMTWSHSRCKNCTGAALARLTGGTAQFLTESQMPAARPFDEWPPDNTGQSMTNQ